MNRPLPPGLKLEVESAFANPLHHVNLVCPDNEEDVKVAPSEIRLYVGFDDVESFFAFRCPSCGDVHADPADADAMAALARIDVATFRIRNEPRSDGPPIGYDDLLDFAVALEGWDGVVS